MVTGLILWWAWPKKAKKAADTTQDDSCARKRTDPDGGPWKTFVSIVGLILLWPLVLVCWGMVGLDRCVYGDDVRKAGNVEEEAGTVETVDPQHNEDTESKEDVDTEATPDPAEVTGGVDTKDSASPAEDDGSEEHEELGHNADSDGGVDRAERPLNGLLWKKSPP